MNHRSRVAYVFRHDYGFIVASLSRRFGEDYLDSVEDAVQFAMIKSMNISSWLDQSYYWKAVMADLQFGLGEVALAGESAEKAIDRAPTEKIKHLLKQRWHIHARNV